MMMNKYETLFQVIRLSEEKKYIKGLPIFYKIDELEEHCSWDTLSVLKLGLKLEDNHTYFVSVEDEIILLTTDEFHKIIDVYGDELMSIVDDAFNAYERMEILGKVYNQEGEI